MVKMTKRCRVLCNIIAHRDLKEAVGGARATQTGLHPPAFQLRHPAKPPPALSSPDLQWRYMTNKPQTANTFAIANRDFLSQF